MTGSERGRVVSVVMKLIALLAVSVALASLLRGGREHDTSPAGPAREHASRIDPRPGPRRVRPPAGAGQFYPAEPGALFDQVSRLLAGAPALGLRGVRAILVPHAGYQFSAEVAAAAFRELGPGFRRVFVLAANHNGQVDFSGVSLPDETHYAIPGAEVPLSAAVDDLREPGLFVHEPRAHTMYMIEVELPFLHQLRGRPMPPDYVIVPMVVGRMDRDAVDRLAEILDGYADPDTVFVFSVDLSHFYTGPAARQLDQYTVDALMARDRSALARARTDGNQVLDTLVALAARRGWEPTFLMARNSGDVTGDQSRVVGYAAIAFHEPCSLTESEQRDLLGLARAAVEAQVKNGHVSEPGRAWIDGHPFFRIPRGVFVTLEKKGQLRGCIGDLKPRQPLYLGVQQAAVNAAVNDHRFSPVTPDELADLSITISVLDYPTRVGVSRPEEYLQVLRPGTDGVILVRAGRRSTFLPQVWKDISDPAQFLANLSLKQGAPRDAWRDPSAELYRYGAYVFHEDQPPN